MTVCWIFIRTVRIRDGSRLEFLEQAAEIPGIYVPALL